tara:strand:+ start:13921 stop:15234 length:1314 start_codon:yes stop_codon:yes gene_type:complete
MIKNYKILFYLNILLFCKTILASTSSSFLISQTAFNNYDFTEVLFQYNEKQNEQYNSDFLDELISAVVKENIRLAVNIASRIHSIDPNNQEAKLVLMVQAINTSDNNKLQELSLDKSENENELFQFLFFNDKNIKTKNDISSSFLEIVRTSYSASDLKYSRNYNFLLFYTSLSILLNSFNYEAIFIKGQLLQMVENYLFAESTFLKIPENSNFYLDAQRQIAFNYSRENDYEDVEDKIKYILNKNKKDYELKKILADFYRVEKKYEKAIVLYSDLIQKNKKDVWYIFYLRGICYERSDNWEKAELDFLESLKIKRDSPDVLNYLAYGWIERDVRINESFVMLTDAYNANPDSYYILDSLAWAYYKKNDYEKAAELMEEVIDMVPGEAISLDHLGDIYFAMNRKREAKYLWRQAKDLASPEDEIIEKIINKLSEQDAK